MKIFAIKKTAEEASSAAEHFLKLAEEVAYMVSRMTADALPSTIQALRRKSSYIAAESDKIAKSAIIVIKNTTDAIMEVKFLRNGSLFYNDRSAGWISKKINISQKLELDQIGIQIKKMAETAQLDARKAANLSNRTKAKLDIVRVKRHVGASQRWQLIVTYV